MEQYEYDTDLVKDYLESLDCFTDEDERKRITFYAIQMDAYRHNEGFRVDRIKDNPREKAFHDVWMHKNYPNPHTNDGQGILQGLFIENKGEIFALPGGRVVERINNRDRMIVATIIQWLGSNVGMGFLHEVLHIFGAHIEFSKEDK